MKNSSITLTELRVAASQYGTEREYWTQNMSGDPSVAAFPPDFVGGYDEQGDARIVKFLIDGDMYSRLMEAANVSDYAVHILLMSVLGILVHKLTGESDLVIGTSIYRPSDVGKYLNSVLPIRIPISPNDSFKEVILKTRIAVLEGNKYQSYPMEILKEDLGRQKLYDIGLTMADTLLTVEEAGMVAPVLFSFVHSPNALVGEISYPGSLYRPETVEGIAGRFKLVLETLLADAMAPISGVSVMTTSEYDWLVQRYNDTTKDYPADCTLAELFEKQCVATPGREAIIDRDESVTYQELNRRANRLARALRQRGVTVESLVAVYMENSIGLVASILAVLKAGGAYVPLNPQNPKNHNKLLLDDCGPVAILTTQDLLRTHEELFHGYESKAVIVDVVDEVGRYDDTNLAAVASGRNLAYVVYTSGTEGRPKAVMIEQRSLLNYVYFAIAQYVQGERVTFALFTSLAFDLTVTSIWAPLLSGNRIVVFQGEHGGMLLEEALRDPRVNVVKATPSHLRTIQHLDWRDSGIRRLIVGGEDFKTRLAGELLARFGTHVEIYNEYGPTETSVGCAIRRFDPATDSRRSVPIGVPIPNTQIYVVDANNNPVPPGVVGEVVIGGDGVARGYLRRQELTDERFFERDGRRFYRSGDRANFLANGELEFVGRTDRQIKVNGFRVELGEIEYQLTKLHLPPMQAGSLEDTNIQTDNRRYCVRCVLTDNYPGIEFDSEGVCSVCRDYDSHKTTINNYFRPLDEFRKIVDANRGPNYDMVLMFSGGKDSTYVLLQLVEMGYKVLTFTFDNGFISDKAFSNIKSITRRLNVENRIVTAEQMNSVFVRSLRVYNNVCNGCWNGINGLGAMLAKEVGCKVIVSGLSRGQIYDMRLRGLFQLGIFDDKEIEEKLLLFRKGFHSRDNMFSKALKIDMESEALDSLVFVDFFRYDATATSAVRQYLSQQGWEAPPDTGICSTNCRINDIGIYVHLANEGYHNYAAPLSWDIRLGIISRQDALGDMAYNLDSDTVQDVLNEIGYYNLPRIQEAVIVPRWDQDGSMSLCAYFVSAEEIATDSLRKALQAFVPSHMVPKYFVRLLDIPVTTNGKVDVRSLPDPRSRDTEPGHVTASTTEERELRKIWASVLGIDELRIGLEDRFFDLGGDSYKIIQLTLQVNEHFSQSMSVVDMYGLPTIRSLMDRMEAGQGNVDERQAEEQETILDRTVGLFREVLE